MSQRAAARTSLTKQLWFRWKALNLPWRKTRLIGQDLAGNTFWEFKNALNPARARRIAKYPYATHYGDVKLSPAWLQWLRHTRADAPSIEEQQLELVRQDNLKQLAAQADARWAQKESFLDNPNDVGQPQPLLEPRDRGGYASPQTQDQSQQGVRSMVGDADGVAESTRGKTQSSKEPSPWTDWESRRKGGPSDSWQPESWNPGKADSR